MIRFERWLTSLLLMMPMLSGCTTLAGSDGPPTFDPSVQAELLQERAARRAAAEANAPEPARADLRQRLARGDELREEGAYAAAMWNYLQAHESNPDDPTPIARMASLHLRVDPGRAESILRDLVAQHPESSAAHTGLGLVLMGHRDWTNARDALERAVALAPRSSTALSALGACLDQLGEHEAARVAYEEAARQNPRSYEALNNLGASYLSTEEFAKAEVVLRRASLQQDRDPAVFNNLGMALGRQGRYRAALDAFRRAGTEQGARNNLGVVYYLNGDYERAMREYERALLAHGDDRLQVLRNLQAAQLAAKAQESSSPASQ